MGIAGPGAAARKSGLVGSRLCLRGVGGGIVCLAVFARLNPRIQAVAADKRNRRRDKKGEPLTARLREEIMRG